MRSRSVFVEESIEEVNEYAYRQGWTEGLPIVPPTEERIARMIAGSGRSGDAVLGVLPPKRADATVEKVAINAVMAGCGPEHFPVVCAAIEALAEHRFELYGINTTTNPAVPMTIVNGPIRNELDINCSWSLFGPRKKANAVIGRAVTLCMLNLSGRVPEETSKATHKNPGAYIMCVGEYEEKNPWEPLHVEHGFKATDSTVTVVSPTGTQNMLDLDSKDADGVLRTFASCMLAIGSTNFFPFYGIGEMLSIFCPDHAAILAKTHTKEQVRRYFLENCWVPRSWVPEHRVKRMIESGTDQVRGDRIYLAARTVQFMLIVAGGLGGFHSVYAPCFGDSYAVTKLIKRP